MPEHNIYIGCPDCRTRINPADVFQPAKSTGLGTAYCKTCKKVVYVKILDHDKDVKKIEKE